MKTMKKMGCLLLALVLAFSLTACFGSDPVSIVKDSELDAYPGKPIGDTLEDAMEASFDDSSVEWEDATETFPELVGDEYDSVVRTVLEGDDSTMILLWLVSTETEGFELYTLSDGGTLYDPTDSYVIDLFDTIFG